MQGRKVHPLEVVSMQGSQVSLQVMQGWHHLQPSKVASLNLEVSG